MGAAIEPAVVWGRQGGSSAGEAAEVLGREVLSGAVMVLRPLLILSMSLVGQACCCWQGKIGTSFLSLVFQADLAIVLLCHHFLFPLAAPALSLKDSPETAYKELVPKARLGCILSQIIKLPAAFPRAGLASVNAENSAEVRGYDRIAKTPSEMRDICKLDCQ